MNNKIIKAVLKTKILADEAVLNMQSRNYPPLIALALTAGICASFLAMTNAIKTREAFCSK